MYYLTLSLHSLIRWLVLLSLLFMLADSYRGWRLNKPYTAFNNKVRIITAAIAHVQLVVGLVLYFISPVVNYFLHHFSTAIRIRDIRFFGMEHIAMMLIGITLITIGSVKAKRKSTGQDKFRVQAIWLTIALVIIFLSVPWSFSPFTSRPLFRHF